MPTVVAGAGRHGCRRGREYLADAMSAQFTRNPLALASALAKIEAAEPPTQTIKRGAAHLSSEMNDVGGHGTQISVEMLGHDTAPVRGRTQG